MHVYLGGEGGVEDGEEAEQGRGEHGDTAAGHEEGSIRWGGEH